MGDEAARAKPITGDLFAHFGLPPAIPRTPGKTWTQAAAARPALPCPRCSWLLTAPHCPICGASSASQQPSADDR